MKSRYSKKTFYSLLHWTYFRRLQHGFQPPARAGDLPHLKPALCHDVHHSLDSGEATACLNILFLLMQLTILRSRFHRSRLGQLLTLFGFGFFINLGIWISSFYIPESYLLRLEEELFGGVMLATGIAFQLLVDISFMPDDGFVRTFSKEYGFPFGTIKGCFDVSIVVVAIVISRCWSQEISGIRERTLRGGSGGVHHADASIAPTLRKAERGKA